MSIVEITRRSYFCASHRLYNPEMSEAENQQVFGCCSNPHGHGHNYWLDVTLAGEPDPRTGMVMNLDHLNQLVQDEVICKIDHRHMNIDVDFMQGVIPTAENLALKIWQILETRLPDGLLKEVRIYESPENFVTCRGA